MCSSIAIYGPSACASCAITGCSLRVTRMDETETTRQAAEHGSTVGQAGYLLALAAWGAITHAIQQIRRAAMPPEWPKDRRDMIPWGPVELDAFESLGKVWTINLRGGMPLSECLLPGQRHHPAGLTNDPLIPVCRSPVDYVSRGVAYLALKEPRMGGTYHLTNPHYATYSETTRVISDMGYPIEIVPEQYVKWIMINPLTPIFEQARHWVIDPSAPGAVAAAGGWIHLLPAIAIFIGTCVLAVWVFRREAPRIAEEL